MPRSYTYCIILLLATLMHGCKDSDVKVDGFDSIENIYFDYQVHAREGEDNLTVRFQFRDFDEDGEAMTLPPNARILLDGEELLPDSTSMTGTYYETHLPANNFSGTHVISFVHGDVREETTFNFSPLSLPPDLSDTLSAKGIDIDLGTAPGSLVRVLLIDTVFSNNGINRVDSLPGGVLRLEADELATLSKGPVQLDLILEYEQILKPGKTAGGQLVLTYTISREFILAE